MENHMTSYAIQAGALRENPKSGPDGVGVQADIAYTLEARAEVQAVCGTPQPANDNLPVAQATGKPLRFLSVCSGIEAASVAWHPLGWRAVAFSEIEKFPSAVLAHHYPGVPNLGDFTKIDTAKLGRVDILAGGTPCQSFSLAGLRGGLDDARGNLTLKFVELAHALADGNGLRNVVWENVVGVLSDKGNAFGCFLAGLVGHDTPIDPPNGRGWSNFGMVSGPKGRAAWAIKDGQFFGVAQRRRRVLVVADFGNGADPAAVLFEPESVPRHSPPRRETGKDIAPSISARTKGGGGLGTDFDLDGGLVQHDEEPVVMAHGQGGAEIGVGLGPTLTCNHEAPIAAYAVSATGPVSHALTGEGHDASEDGTAQDYGADASEEISPTLRSGNHSASHANGGVMPAIAQTVAIRGHDGGATAELGGDVATALRASQGRRG
jgi:DNA (cytosine-5)-methyltransferase 1